MATAALETVAARLRGGNGAYAITLQTCGERLLLKIVQTSKTSSPELTTLISRHVAEPFWQLPRSPGTQPLPYRTHQAHTARCWTPWRSPAPVHLGRAANTHLEPAPCTDSRPGTPRSGPGCRDRLEEKRLAETPPRERSAQRSSERHDSKSSAQHDCPVLLRAQNGEMKAPVLLHGKHC